MITEPEPATSGLRLPVSSINLERVEIPVSINADSKVGVPWTRGSYFLAPSDLARLASPLTQRLVRTARLLKLRYER